jgi:hypothetical protein
MNFINEIYQFIVLDLFGGQAIIDLLDRYFLLQSDANKVLIALGMLGLSTIGIISIIRSILRMASGIVKIILLGVVGYYVITVLIPFDVILSLF